MSLLATGSPAALLRRGSGSEMSERDASRSTELNASCRRGEVGTITISLARRSDQGEVGSSG